MNQEEYLKGIITARDKYVDGIYKIDDTQAAAYNECVAFLSSMDNIELSYDDIREPYTHHTISIEWKLIDEYVEINMSTLREMVSKLNGTIIIPPYSSSDWTIVCAVYSEL